MRNTIFIFSSCGLIRWCIKVFLFHIVEGCKAHANHKSFRLLRCGATLSFMFAGILASAQNKANASLQQVWLGYFNHSRISNKWGAMIDVHVRTSDNFFENYSQTIIRGGLSYFINDRTRITVGDAYVHYFSADASNKLSEIEHRPWQQLHWQKNYATLRTTQAVRIEERFRTKVMAGAGFNNVTSFNFRFRYNFSLQVPLAKVKFSKGTFSFVVTDEVNFNAGKQIVYNWFDQNRFFAGFNYHVTKDDNLQIGYMNVWQHLAGAGAYSTRHVARVYFIHNLDWRKGK